MHRTDNLMHSWYGMPINILWYRNFPVRNAGLWEKTRYLSPAWTSHWKFFQWLRMTDYVMLWGINSWFLFYFFFFYLPGKQEGCLLSKSSAFLFSSQTRQNNENASGFSRELRVLLLSQFYIKGWLLRVSSAIPLAE